MEKRIIAFDIGDRRVGVAISDPFNRYAMPLETYFRTGNSQRDAEALATIARQEDVGKIVCGLPVHADGTESEQTRKTLRFLEALKGQTQIPIETEDERYTTREARSDLNFLGVSVKQDKGRKAVDSLAAAYILESYLNRKERAMSYKEDYNNYEDDALVELVDEEGVKRQYEHLMTFEYKQEWYVALAPTSAEQSEQEDEDDGDDGGEEIAIYHLVGGEDAEELEIIEDDELLDEVFAEFCNLYEDFEDADEAAALEPDENDNE